MKSFLLASGNLHKAQEFREIFKDVIKITAAPQALEVDENGKTFIENALIKARSYYKKFKLPAVADDSGLVLESFPDLLGVQSARFMPELPHYSDKCQKLLEIMNSAPAGNRRAYFICVLCFYISDDEVFFFEGRAPGVIADSAKGEGGFGYDPIFIPDRKENDNKTLAELPEWKNVFSHRARACQGAMGFFKESMDKTLNKS